jgi:hypothetical protein
MSAWIVSEDHIDALVCGAIVHNVPFDGKEVTAQNATEVGQALWEENHKSINHRYAHHGITPTPEYRFIGETTLKPEWLFKQAACYNYQTCEHPGYRESAAKRFVEDLTHAISEAMDVPVDMIRASREYDNGPWGI